MSVGCVIPAAGRGERMGEPTPKALLELGGITLLEHAIRAMVAAREIRFIVVAAPPDYLAEVQNVLNGIDVTADLSVVGGGATRSDSVAEAVSHLPPEATIVLVHDAARPLVPVEVVHGVISACAAGAPAVVPVVPVNDTIKQVGPTGLVLQTVDRSELRAAQTPQGFDRSTLSEVLRNHHAAATDDAGSVEQSGVPVLVVPGHPESLKITRPFDLMIAEALLDRRRTNRGEVSR